MRRLSQIHRDKKGVSEMVSYVLLVIIAVGMKNSAVYLCSLFLLVFACSGGVGSICFNCPIVTFISCLYHIW